MQITRPAPKVKIPKSAKNVFKGLIFDVYQWEQKLFDGSLATFERLKRVDTVNVIPVTRDRKIILLHQRQPGTALFTGFAGGRIDGNEGVAAAAERELVEVTGYRAQKKVLWDAIQPTAMVDWAIYTFIAQNCRRVAKPNLEAGEKIKLKFFKWEDFFRVVSAPNFRDTEITLKALKIKDNPQELENFKRLLLGD